MHRALFLCSRNRLRSPTAERVFASWPGVETDSAGLSADADCELSSDQLFGPELRGKRVVCLEIPDDYTFMQPELVSLLEAKAGPHLSRPSRRPGGG